MGYDTTESIVAEIEQYATNTSAFITPVMRTLSKKHQAGNFDLDRAIAYVDRYCLIPAAKQYRREFGSMTDSWSGMFPKAIRMMAAESIVRHAVAEFKLGNYWN